MKRPQNKAGSTVTTPRTAAMMQLLGSAMSAGSFEFSQDEWRNVKKLYGFKKEKSNKKPPPPVPPVAGDFPDTWKFEHALREHERAMDAWERWEDPRPLMQAGADRNAIREAQLDGLRLLTWIAKFIPPGEDPLKTLVQMAADAGWDVDYNDASWAEADSEEVDSDESEDVVEA